MALSHQDPKYRIDTEVGQLFFNSGDDERIVGDIDLAIAYSADSENPFLLKHGPADKVIAYADKVKVADPDVRCITIPWEVLIHPIVGPQVIAEVNSCLAISGRVGHLVERLMTITESVEIELFPRFGNQSVAASPSP